VFNAIAEPRRRQIIEALAAGEERDVTELVHRLRLPQPAVSKHLRVLRSVRLVTVSRRGRRRVYRLNPRELKTVHDWVKHFERFWSHQIARIKARAEARASEQQRERIERARQPKEQS
jgi:DNA-binding transcriptional ArsR family regulator